VYGLSVFEGSKLKEPTHKVSIYRQTLGNNIRLCLQELQTQITFDHRFKQQVIAND